VERVPLVHDVCCGKRIACPAVGIIRDGTETGLAAVLLIPEACCQSQFWLSNSLAEQQGVSVECAREHRPALMINMRTQRIKTIRGDDPKSGKFRHNARNQMTRTWRATLT